MLITTVTTIVSNFCGVAVVGVVYSCFDFSDRNVVGTDCLYNKLKKDEFDSVLN
jgi:hypothetical protein